MLTLGQAAKTAKRGKATIQKALNNGTLSGTRDASGRWLIDPAELHRVFPFEATQISTQIDPEPLQNRSDPRDIQIKWLTAALDRERGLNDELRAELRTERERIMHFLASPKHKSWWPWGHSRH